MTIKNNLQSAVNSAASALGPDYALAYMAAAGPEEAGAPVAAIGLLDSVITGVLTAVNAAAAELEAVKKDLEENPAIDSSASDAEEAATEADMPDGD